MTESFMASKPLYPRLLLVTFLWSLCYPLITLGIPYTSPLFFAAARALLAGALLLGVGLLTRRPMPPLRAWGGLLLVGLTFTGLGFAGMFLAGGKISPGLATLLSNVQPLLAALIGFFVLRETLWGAHGLAMAVGFTGILIIALPGLGAHSALSTPAGIGFVLMGAIGVALGNVLLKRMAGSLDPVMAMGGQLLLGGVFLLGASILIEPIASTQWTRSFGFALAALASVGTALPFVLWLDLLQEQELNHLNVFTFLTPVFALVIAALFFKERLGWVEWLGASLVLLASLLNKARRPSPSSR